MLKAYADENVTNAVVQALWKRGRHEGGRFLVFIATCRGMLSARRSSI